MRLPGQLQVARIYDVHGNHKNYPAKANALHHSNNANCVLPNELLLCKDLPIYTPTGKHACEKHITVFPKRTDSLKLVKLTRLQLLKLNIPKRKSYSKKVLLVPVINEFVRLSSNMNCINELDNISRDLGSKCKQTFVDVTFIWNLPEEPPKRRSESASS